MPPRAVGGSAGRTTAADFVVETGLAATDRGHAESPLAIGSASDSAESIGLGTGPGVCLGSKLHAPGASSGALDSPDSRIARGGGVGCDVYEHEICGAVMRTFMFDMAEAARNCGNVH